MRVNNILCNVVMNVKSRTLIKVIGSNLLNAQFLVSKHFDAHRHLINLMLFGNQNRAFQFPTDKNQRTLRNKHYTNNKLRCNDVQNVPLQFRSEVEFSDDNFPRPSAQLHYFLDIDAGVDEGSCRGMMNRSSL